MVDKKDRELLSVTSVIIDFLKKKRVNINEEFDWNIINHSMVYGRKYALDVIDRDKWNEMIASQDKTNEIIDVMIDDLEKLRTTLNQQIVQIIEFDVETGNITNRAVSQFYETIGERLRNVGAFVNNAGDVCHENIVMKIRPGFATSRQKFNMESISVIAFANDERSVVELFDKIGISLTNRDVSPNEYQEDELNKIASKYCKVAKRSNEK